MIHLTYVTTITVFLFILTILIRHSSNIKRLLAGKEPVTVFKKDVKKDADENENKIITIAINELKKEINIETEIEISISVFVYFRGWQVK